MKIKTNEGQTFVEFVFLMAVMMGIGYALLAGVNGGVGKRWTSLVKLITYPSQSTVELR